MKKEEIINEIDNRVGSSKTVDYRIWTIGITEDPDRRRGEHSNPKYWRSWRADTESIARIIEKHFLDRGMKGGGGGGQHPTYVYIF